MNGVLGMIEVLLHGQPTTEQREQLGLAHRSGEALVSLINDLLDMSKIEAGKLEVVPGDFALRALLSDVQHLFSPLAEQKNLALELEVAPAVPEQIRGDALRLRQVLANLVNNGLKFTAAGKVTIAVSAPVAGRVRFSVSDTGIGIPADVLPRLMVPFAQADASTTRRYGGTGLGLALSRELVALMGGTLSVQTEPGRGTCFSFELPFEAARAPLTQPGAPAKPAPSHAARLPVLVVDDNPINLRVATSLVERAGFPTRTATNGREALELMQRERFGLVLMDCHMPEMDGYETTERLRAMPGPLAKIPVVALTASAMPEDLERCRLAGMNECLTKPIAYDALAEMLTRFEATLPA
jgi:CheY-like chemotaxis protein